MIDEQINEALAELQHEVELLRDNEFTEKIQALISEIERLVDFIKSLDPGIINKKFEEIIISLNQINTQINYVREENNNNFGDLNEKVVQIFKELESIKRENKLLSERTEELLSTQKKNLVLSYTVIVMLIAIILILFLK